MRRRSSRSDLHSAEGLVLLLTLMRMPDSPGTCIPFTWGLSGNSSPPPFGVFPHSPAGLLDDLHRLAQVALAWNFPIQLGSGPQLGGFGHEVDLPVRNVPHHTLARAVSVNLQDTTGFPQSGLHGDRKGSRCDPCMLSALLRSAARGPGLPVPALQTDCRDELRSRLSPIRRPARNGGCWRWRR